MDSSPPPDRFAALVLRELKADDVRVLRTGLVPSPASNVISARLDDGRHVLVSFASAPGDREALERRLEMLARTFAQALDDPPGPGGQARLTRPLVPSSLAEELRALGVRAQACEVLVIDADSPIVWGSATGNTHGVRRSQVEDLLLSNVVHEADVTSQDNHDKSAVADDASGQSCGANESKPWLMSITQNEAMRRAIDAVRALPALSQIHKGRHLHHVLRDVDFGFLALSFSGIYVLVLVFDEAFDELRAERAASDALPRIERLVMALPPLDPEPEPRGDVISFRRGRRR